MSEMWHYFGGVVIGAVGVGVLGVPWWALIIAALVVQFLGMATAAVVRRRER